MMFWQGTLRPADPVMSYITQATPRYYILHNGQPKGPYRIDELRKIPGFTLQTQMRVNPMEAWKPAFTVIDLKTYVGQAPSRKDADHILAEARRRTAANAHKAWMRAAGQHLQRFFRQLLVSISVASIGSAGVYTLYVGTVQRNLWRTTVLHQGHRGLQGMIGWLTHMDQRYFAPTPGLLPALIPPHPRVATVPLPHITPLAKAPMAVKSHSTPNVAPASSGKVISSRRPHHGHR